MSDVWSTAVAPRIVIDNLMFDETQHHVRVTSGAPGWLLSLRNNAKLAMKSICGPLNHADAANAPGPADDTPTTPNTTSRKRRRKPKIKRGSAVTGGASTWGVLVIRRNIAWLTTTGAIMECPLVSLHNCTVPSTLAFWVSFLQ